MTDDLAAVVLAAGAGTRLRPLTDILPKAMCPVDNVALVDLAIDRVRPLTPLVAVNVHHGRSHLEAHLAGRVHLSMEPELLGTAGALGRLRDWIHGRATVVVNADALAPLRPLRPARRMGRRAGPPPPRRRRPRSGRLRAVATVRGVDHALV
ncbi:MAG: nucleotidyltransferase family protein [Acidimicrobiales bacterium]